MTRSSAPAVVLARAGVLSAADLLRLAVAAEAEGWRFVRRLADGWSAGARFNQPGEALFLARAGDTLVGVCGLASNPYSTDPTVGRVRHLYVLPTFRGRGVGRRLLAAAVGAAAGRYRLLRLRTDAAGDWYERLGFVPAAGVPDCTHLRELVPPTAGR